MIEESPPEDDENPASGGESSTGGASSGGAPMETGGTSTGGEPYIEPDCPDEPPPPVFSECDPLAPFEDCEEGLGCYPYLEYPYGEGCGFPTFGAICAVEGEGEQGEFCGDDLGYCAPGFMCVVGAAGGKRCGQICSPMRDHMCPPGLICGETDIQGFGVCF